MAMRITGRSKTTIVGLAQDLSDLNTAITNEATNRGNADGVLANLTTTAKGNLVSAINEVKLQSTNLGNDYLSKADNLASVADAEEARANLDVYSTSEVDTEITTAINNHLAGFGEFRGEVADIAARNALTTATISSGDTVKVLNDGDSKWAIYRASVSSGVISWSKELDQDGANAWTKEALKATYESNDDTNAFTDTEKTKVGFISITAERDLDKMIQSDELTSAEDIVATGYVGAEDKLASEAAVVAMAHEAARLGGSRTIIETRTVSEAGITLTHTPKDGLYSILNFGQVRYIDDTNVLAGGAGASYDIDLIAVVGQDKQFKVDSGSTSAIDGQSVKVQYTYVPA